jgi:hypothetical protein
MRIRTLCIFARMNSEKSGSSLGLCLGCLACALQRLFEGSQRCRDELKGSYQERSAKRIPLEGQIEFADHCVRYDSR